ncbi:MAG: hypothetical protein IT211_01685 [Armatimonadetes bacterium]|nr:hypothetical protein [Armatimonadota bacterium]
MLLSALSSSFAQEADSGSLQLSGQAQLAGDFYGSSSSPTGFEPSVRPSSLLRLVLTPTVAYGEFQLPITIAVSSKQTNVTTPFAPEQSFQQFLQNPLNTVSLSPKYGWAQLHLGTQTPRYSELSTGDVPGFGVGAELAPGPLLVAGFYGTTQRAIQPDSTANIIGAYRRTMLAAKLGLGDRELRYVDFTAVHVADDTTSIIGAPIGFVPPQQGSLASLATFFRLSNQLSLKAEGAVSLFTRDQRSAEFAGNDLDFLSPIQPIRESTRLDVGAMASVVFNENFWGAEAELRYLGDGFVPLGYPYQPTDLFELRFSPRAQFLDNRLILNGTIGYRINNLSGTNLQTATQILGMANVVAQLTDALMVAASYTNFGLRNNIQNDTLKIRTVNQSFSITPSYTLRGESLLHTITATVALNDYSDANTLTGALNNSNTTSLFGTWTTAFQAFPLTLSATLSSVQNTFSGAELSLLSAAIGGGYRLMEGRLRPSLRLGWSRNTFAGFTPDNSLTLQADAAWSITETLTWDLSGTTTLYSYGSSRGGGSASEQFLRTGMTTRF